eukprot:11223541-Lingulodinium_polyedra.AAC.1
MVLGYPPARRHGPFFRYATGALFNVRGLLATSTSQVPYQGSQCESRPVPPAMPSVRNNFPRRSVLPPWRAR